MLKSWCEAGRPQYLYFVLPYLHYAHIPFLLKGDPLTENLEIVDLDLVTEMETTKMENVEIEAEAGIEIERVKEAVERGLVKVVAAEVKIDQKRDEVEAENGVINEAEVKAENEEGEAGAMREKEVEVGKEVIQIGHNFDRALKII